MSSTLYCMLMGILLFCPETDSGSLTWNEPLPIQNIPDNAIVEHTNHTELIQGTNASLTWHFSLSSDLTFDSLTITFDGDAIAGVRSSGQGVISGFEDKYGISWIPSKRITLYIFHVTTAQNGTFVCEVNAAKGLATPSWESNIHVDLLDSPSNISASSDLNITAPANLTLNCSANGKPEPTITWKRLSDNTEVTMPLSITGRQDAGDYMCTAANGVGNPLTKNVSIIMVLFRPKISLPKKFYVGREQNVSLTCTVDGNPTPTISWTPCNLPNHVCDKQYLNISKVKTARTTYICNASNYLGSDSATTVLFIGGVNIFLRLSISEECEKKKSVWETLKNELDKVFAQNQLFIGAELIRSSCGSLIFDLVLKFDTEVAEGDIISTIKSAAVDGKLGELTVNTSSIIGIPPVILSTTTASTTTSSESDSGNIWIIVGAVLGAVALVVIIAVIVWCVRKNKCSNKKKEVSDGNDAGQGKGGGAQGQNAGDESAYDSAYSNATVLPPSKKPTSTGKEDAGQAIALPVYAQVDKSKKKPRSEKEAQRQPGELLYVQADHSNEGSLPTKASGNPSRPPPYQDTVYADLV